MAIFSPGPNDIEFTQYLMPHGRHETVWIERPDNVVKKAGEIREAGFRFGCEMLGDYKTISLTISDDDDDRAIEVVPNGPAIPDAIDRMILAFDISHASAATAAE